MSFMRTRTGSNIAKERVAFEKEYEVARLKPITTIADRTAILERQIAEKECEAAVSPVCISALRWQ